MFNDKTFLHNIIKYLNFVSISTFIAVALVSFTLKAEAHNGQTDQYGCHYSSEYHCH